MIKHILLFSIAIVGLVACGGGGDSGTTIPVNNDDFTLSTNQLTFTADVSAATPASQNITGTLKNEVPNATIEIVIVSNVNLFASKPAFITTGTKSGSLTINPISPSILGAGSYTATITVYICSVLTNDCANSNSQLSGSPKVVNVTYTVTDVSAGLPSLNGTYYGSIQSTYNNCAAEGMVEGTVVSSSGTFTIGSQIGKDWTASANFVATANSNLSTVDNIWAVTNTITDGIVDTAGNIQGTISNTVTSGAAPLVSGNAAFTGTRSLTGNKLTLNSTLNVAGSSCQRVTTMIARILDVAPSFTADTSNTSCIANPTLDAEVINGVAKLKKSHKTGIYGKLASRSKSDGAIISIDYMVHTNASNEKALIVLIPGGNGDAKLDDTTVIGANPITSSGNFLIRSAKLFAAQGYRVVSVDRPIDASLTTIGAEYDTYRVSVLHAVDLSRIINAENPNNLPVIISGTSRGTISAVPNHSLASAIALSSPLTATPTGITIGTPIGLSDSPENLKATYVDRPVHVSWHSMDGCGVTPPIRSLTLSDKILFANNAVKTDSIAGGFIDPNPLTTDPCKGKTYHGFLGIESCAVSRQTKWMSSVVTGLATNAKPVATAHTFSTPIAAGSSSSIINLAVITAPAKLVTDDDVTDTHQFAVPYSTTTLGGSITITSSGVATYTPPAVVTANTQDHFVYVVNDYDETGVIAKGGTANNVFTVNITP